MQQTEDSNQYRMRLLETTPMVLSPYKGLNMRGKVKVTEGSRYQTLFTDEFWTDETRNFVLLAALPEDFNQNKYEAQICALFQQLYSKNRAASTMKVGGEEDKFKIKRPLEPAADYAETNRAQLVTLLKDEDSSKDAM